jgi:hypothetical protein
MKEITLDGIPGAGEPLTPQVDESNQVLIESSIQERIERQ